MRIVEGILGSTPNRQGGEIPVWTLGVVNLAVTQIGCEVKETGWEFSRQGQIGEGHTGSSFVSGRLYPRWPETKGAVDHF